ncbi:PREDICTED: uncharacterized protein LOC107329600, partial [Acropora digitifera]|uniref:uncharacterized protein LOC107329600 n=1 Tax=Acropora digitifera TaxID=70779 RepID=UPI00077A93ED
MFRIQTVDQIQMGLRYGMNAYKSVQDAWLGAMTSERKGCYPVEKPGEPKIMLVAIAEGAIMNERVTLFTKGHECYDLKLNCRENLSLSVEPIFLYLYKPLKDDEVGDLAVIKFSPSPSGQKQVYAAECEGLILRHKMILNPEKYKEMYINSMAYSVTSLRPICVGYKDVERVGTYKLLGMIISDDLKWNAHVEYVVAKAAKRLFALRLLKRA